MLGKQIGSLVFVCGRQKVQDIGRTRNYSNHTLSDSISPTWAALGKIGKWV